ncbi:MAG TPA: hypothetical protein VMU77_02110 [Acidimicrobiales bacterium]|nr:hypothetical protein [Acidimicrobiales bacterium]
MSALVPIGAANAAQSSSNFNSRLVANETPPSWHGHVALQPSHLQVRSQALWQTHPNLFATGAVRRRLVGATKAAVLSGPKIATIWRVAARLMKHTSDYSLRLAVPSRRPVAIAEATKTRTVRPKVLPARAISEGKSHYASYGSVIRLANNKVHRKIGHAVSGQICLQGSLIEGQSICTLAAPQGPQIDPPTNWKEVYTSSAPYSGLTDISCVDASDCIAGGVANVNGNLATPLVDETHDGGSTWS